MQGNLQEETRERLGINSARDFNSFVALSAIEAAVLLFVMLARRSPVGDFLAQRGFHADIAA